MFAAEISPSDPLFVVYRYDGVTSRGKLSALLDAVKVKFVASKIFVAIFFDQTY